MCIGTWKCVYFNMRIYHTHIAKIHCKSGGRIQPTARRNALCFHNICKYSAAGMYVCIVCVYVYVYTGVYRGMCVFKHADISYTHWKYSFTYSSAFVFIHIYMYRYTYISISLYVQ